MLAAAALALITVLPAFAAPSPVRLLDPAVTPRNVSAGTSVTFQVTYKSPSGAVPSSVSVQFGGSTYVLTAVAGKKNVHAGVRYEVRVAPSAGSDPVRFVATDELGRTTTLAAGILTVATVSAGGSAGGAGSAGSASTGSGSGSGSAGSSSTGSGSGSGSAGSASTGSGSGSGSGSSSGGSSAGGPSGSTSTGSGSGSGGSSAAGTGSATSGSDSADGTSTGGSTRAGGATSGNRSSNRGTAGPVSRPSAGLVPGGSAVGLAAGAATLTGSSAAGQGGGTWRRSVAGTAGAIGGLTGIGGLGDGLDRFTAVLPSLVTTFGGVTMLMAFGLFGKRRRDGQPTGSDESLAAAAAMGYGAIASSAFVGIAAGPLTPAAAPVPVDAELAMPRWRRPSLLEARKADPLRSVASAEGRLTFDDGLVGPVDGFERRRIRYSIVRLLDGPDELTASDVGVLDAGDEVQLLERSGVHWFVLCPNGQRGWVHKMVLGDEVEAPRLPGPAARATGPREAGDIGLAASLLALDTHAARETPPGADPIGYDPTPPGSAWMLQGVPASDAGADVDDDVLQAFLASRGRG